MQSFAYIRARDSRDAQRLTGGGDMPPIAAPAQFIAGGTQMLDLMKLGIMRPERLVDINDVGALRGEITAGPEGLVLPALTRMSDAADHAAIRRDYPVIAESLRLAASAQLRNMASLAGNILQRTRCAYFRDTHYASCNKRAPGSGCAAIGGNTRKHAVLGASDACIASYPGDFAIALVALDAGLRIEGPRGARTLRVAQLHTGPEHPERETVLLPGEIITHIVVPAGAHTRRSVYVKVRDRESYEFGIATAAVALDMQNNTVRAARIGLGGVAYRPWRSEAAEAALQDKPVTEETASQAAAIAFHGAVPRGENAFKVELGQRTLVRALLHAATMEA